jgi:hypothetical protein
VSRTHSKDSELVQAVLHKKVVARMRKDAEREGLSISSWIRRLILQHYQAKAAQVER